jgi:DNA polymerase-3 subunit gamma/tau
MLIKEEKKEKSKSLYQKYRPLIFDEIVGHKNIVKALKDLSKKRKIPQGIFLSGFSGVGKTTLARIIAKAIVCKNIKEDGNPCNECIYCQDINNEIFNLSCFTYNGGDMKLEQMQELKMLAERATLQSPIRVFFIDELQEMASAQKAMKNILDILETPPSSSYFILGAMDDSKVPSAIKDRTISYKLQNHSYEDVANHLYQVLQKEGITEIGTEKSNALITIATSCDGSIRNALSSLERCIQGDIWSEEDIKRELNILGKNALHDSVVYLLKGDTEIFNDIELDKNKIEQIRSLLILAYKKANGVELNTWLKNRVGSLNKLFELQKYIYLTKELIDFYLIDILNHNKKNILTKLNENKVVEVKPTSRPPRGT